MQHSFNLKLWLQKCQLKTAKLATTHSKYRHCFADSCKLEEMTLWHYGVCSVVSIPHIFHACAVCTSMNLRNCQRNLQKSLFAKNWDPQKFSTTWQNTEVHMYINSLIQCDVLFHSTSLLAGTTHSGFGMLAALKVSQQSTNDISPRCYTIVTHCAGHVQDMCRTCAGHVQDMLWPVPGLISWARVTGR